MIKRRLSFLIAFGVTCCGFNAFGTAKALIPKPTNFIVAQNSSSQAFDALETVKLSYDALMQAGYAADQERDYRTALEYFRQALTLRPNDSWANKAVRNITSYSFDRYMQAGYQADLSRNYQVALKHFQQALEIKPNSFYAQKAVNNISQYLAVTEPEPDNNQTGEGFNVLWLLMAIAGTAGISAILLFFLFRKTHHIEVEPVTEAQKAENFLNSTDTVVRSEPTVSPKPSETPANQTIIFADAPKTSVNSPQEVGQPAPKNLASPKTEANDSSEIVATNSQTFKLDIVPELIAELEKSDRRIRQKTIWELAQRGDSRAMQPLVELMIKVDSQERGLILEAMTQIASRTLKPMNKALMVSLDDDNPHVKQNAIRDLTRVYELMNQVTKRLSQVVEDSDEEVQKTAQWALKQLNQLPTVPLWQNSNRSENNQDVSN
ncbi:MAG TPA: hypothetical protein ACFCUY_09120 [Xenococcaceae cyanobacterium]|jgi:tetratricopeptide (TPR) repeat protein